LAIAQTFLSLLDNAYESACANPLIEIDITDQDKFICLEFRDRGCGVPREIMNHLGEPFVTSKATGTGLGLYNAISLLQALGGNLEVMDRSGGGTIVKLTIPCHEELTA
jgi:signal transduction histidine kinase